MRVLARKRERELERKQMCERDGVVCWCACEREIAIKRESKAG